MIDEKEVRNQIKKTIINLHDSIKEKDKQVDVQKIKISFSELSAVLTAYKNKLVDK